MLDNETRFGAPWGTSLIVMTSLSIFITVLAVCLGIFVVPISAIFAKIMMIILPACILLGSLFFIVRGYQFQTDQLLVQRLYWKTKINLTGLSQVTHVPDVMSGASRTFGNGGMFSFSGKFHNPKVGSYRAFATDPKRSVVLRTPKGAYVITPDSPEVFIEAIKKMANLD